MSLNTVDKVFREASQGVQGAGGGIVDKVEHAFDSVGLMRGNFAPLKRAGVGFLLASGLVYAIRPSVSFDSSGRAKQWSALEPEESDADTTSVPWWYFGLAGAAVLGLLV